jgi:hypothetical protein
MTPFRLSNVMGRPLKSEDPERPADSFLAQRTLSPAAERAIATIEAIN